MLASFFKKELNRTFFFCLHTIVMIPLVASCLLMNSTSYYTIPVLFLVAVAAIAGGLFHLNSRITRQLCNMRKSAEKLANGDLSETFSEDAPKEVRDISKHLNSFTINQQETLLFAWNVSGETITGMETVLNSLLNDTKTVRLADQNDFIELLDNARTAHSMLGEFIYFDVQLAGGSAIISRDTVSYIKGSLFD